MRVLRKDDIVQVTLSRRNLLALLSKLDDHPGSERCIYHEGERLILRVEEDAEHYSPDRPPGAMHPIAEKFIRNAGPRLNRLWNGKH